MLAAFTGLEPPAMKILCSWCICHQHGRSSRASWSRFPAPEFVAGKNAARQAITRSIYLEGEGHLLPFFPCQKYFIGVDELDKDVMVTPLVRMKFKGPFPEMAGKFMLAH